MVRPTILAGENIEAAYGKKRVLHGLSWVVPEGAIIAILGANGAGKTTLLRTISGLLFPSQGSIKFLEESIEFLAAEKRVVMGISQVPQNRAIFRSLTVFENLKMGAFCRKDQKGFSEDLERVYSYFPILSERAKQLAETLSGGEQQMLAIGRALMSKPKLLLLDEPSLGLAPLVTEKIYEIIEKLNKDENVTILLVEQNANLALTVSLFAYIMETGLFPVSGPSRELLENDYVKTVYLAG
jgi:branched-chain amino acid transport system ATP-binding protein